MAQTKKYKCLSCSHTFAEEETKKVSSNRRMCLPCYQTYSRRCSVCKGVFPEPCPHIVNFKPVCDDCKNGKSKPTERNYYGELIALICNRLGIAKPSPYIMNNLKNFRIRYDMTDLGMQSTLLYMEEHIGSTIRKESDIFNLVKYYGEAKSFHIELARVRNYAKSMDDDFLYPSRNIVIPKVIRVNPQEEMIDISQFVDEESEDEIL